MAAASSACLETKTLLCPEATTRFTATRIYRHSRYANTVDCSVRRQDDVYNALTVTPNRTMTSQSTTSSTAVATNSSASRSGTRPQEQEEARAAVLASLGSAGSHYNSQFQRRAADLHANAQNIATQEAEVAKQAKALSKETGTWQKELDKATRGIKDVGDVQNWAEMMERDLLVLEETMRLAEGGERVESASGGSSWRL